jgi:hypothetical protein
MEDKAEFSEASRPALTHVTFGPFLARCERCSLEAQSFTNVGRRTRCLADRMTSWST